MKTVRTWLQAALYIVAFFSLQGFFDLTTAAPHDQVEQERTMQQQFHEDAKATQLMLSGFGINVPLEQIEDWSDEQLRQADDFAGARHFHSNAIEVPDFLKRYEVKA